MNREVRQLAWFVWRHYPPAKDWGRELVRKWLAWACSEGFVGVILYRRERIIGCGIARPVMLAELAGYDRGYFDNEGDCMFVDLAVAPTTAVFKQLSILMRKRFGIRDRIAFKRGDALVRVYPYRTLMRRHLFRKDIVHHG